MAMEARMFGQPCLDVRFLVRPVIVHNQVQVHVWKPPVHQAQELQPLLMAGPGLTLPNDFAVQHIQGGKEGGRPMSNVVVSVGASTPLLERQPWLGPVQGLNLALFIQTQPLSLYLTT